VRACRTAGKALLFVLSFVVLSACGRATETNGFITRTQDGVVKVDPAKEEEVCGADRSKCEPNYIVHAHFGRKPAQDTQDYSRSIMHVPDAWKISEGSPTVTVAVVDTGAAHAHPDLAANLLPGYDFIKKQDVAEDDNKHGTHCAGIIAALHNGTGTVGVAPNVKILPLKFLDSTGSGDTAGAIAAIDYAVAHGVKVISNSWGGGDKSQLLQDSIAKAVAAGIFVVASAGNDASNNDSSPSYPASYPGVISVASSDESDALSSFSNFGQTGVWIAAPGSNIYSTVLNGKYENLSGTSMAGPQVAGAIALAVSVKPNLTVDQARQALCDTSKKILTSKVACGRLDVAAFVQRVSQL
jgi:subtilisin family serine protease